MQTPKLFQNALDSAIENAIRKKVPHDEVKIKLEGASFILKKNFEVNEISKRGYYKYFTTFQNIVIDARSIFLSLLSAVKFLFAKVFKKHQMQ